MTDQNFIFINLLSQVKSLFIPFYQFSEIRSELERAKSVFTERLSELTRQMSWFIAVTYSKVSLPPLQNLAGRKIQIEIPVYIPPSY